MIKKLQKTVITNFLLINLFNVIFLAIAMTVNYWELIRFIVFTLQFLLNSALLFSFHWIFLRKEDPRKISISYRILVYLPLLLFLIIIVWVNREMIFHGFTQYRYGLVFPEKIHWYEIKIFQLILILISCFRVDRVLSAENTE